MIGQFLKSASSRAAHNLIFGPYLRRREGARLLTPTETGQLLSPWNTGLVLDGGRGRLSERESFQNVCVIARVGAGKTSRYIIPNVLDKAKRNCSLVVNDPKGEVYEATSGYMQSRGYRVITLSPEDLQKSARFNPLLEAKTDIEIEQVAEILIKAGSGLDHDPFWNNGAIRLVSVLLKLLQRAGYVEPGWYTLGNLYYLLQNFGKDGAPLEDFVIKWAYDPSNPNDSTLWDEWNGVLTGNEKTLQSFVINALTALRAFTNQNMVQLTSESSFDLEDIRDEKTVIYFIIPAQHTEYYGFWTSVFFRSVFNACMRRMPSRTSLPVYVLYDEFGHSTLPNFVSVANTIRGYRVSLSIVLQSLSQLAARYGHDYARSIQGGFNTYLAYSGADLDTARFFEEIAGRVVEVQKNRLDEHKEERHEYNLLNADAVRRIGASQAIMVSANQNPALLETVPYFANPSLRRVPARYGAARLEGGEMPALPKKVPLA